MRLNMKLANSIQEAGAFAERAITFRRKYKMHTPITEGEQQALDELLKRVDSDLAALRESAREAGYLV